LGAVTQIIEGNVEYTEILVVQQAGKELFGSISLEMVPIAVELLKSVVLFADLAEQACNLV